MTAQLRDTLTLPCGAVLKNRIAKGAMTEGIANFHNNATEMHADLYRQWAQGGCGLLISGNVQIDRRFLERAGNVVIDNNGGLAEIAAYAAAGTESGTQMWMQINHPGRQAGAVSEKHVAPSDCLLVGSDETARALTPAEIEDIEARFRHVAIVARDSGFTGVQVHAAHGYLMSQFLSPLINHRTDKWGGSLENRARLLLDIVAGMRADLGPHFPISVKLNSSDFQKGGLTEDESIQIVKWLCDAGLDLLEISGGSYESQMMVGRDQEGGQVKVKKASTLAREAYFVEFAARLRPHVSIPLMVTGGFRTRAAMEGALAAGEVDLIGIARPLCIDPALPHALLAGEIDRLPSPDDDTPVDAPSSIAYYFNRVRELAAGLPTGLPIDWHAELERHTAWDAACNVLYLEDMRIHDH